MDEETDTEASENEEPDGADEEEVEDEDANEEGEDLSMLSIGEEEIATGNPFWLLFKAVATHTDEKGKSTVKPFLKLPNRRYQFHNPQYETGR